MSKYLVPLLLAALLVSNCASPQFTATPLSPPSTPRPVQVIRDVPYVVAGDASQELDVYLPGMANPPFPTILVIHGSGADKADWSEIANGFATDGYAVVSINYREMPQHAFPGPAEDAFCALAWIHSSSDAYGFDAGRVVVMGYSAGATLAALIGTVNDTAFFMRHCPHPISETGRPNGVVSVAGLFDTVLAADTSTVWHSSLVAYLGSEPEDAPDLWAQSSAVHWVDGAEPPFLLVHGLEDRNTDPQQARTFATALREAGGDVQLVLVPAADHETTLHSEEGWQAIEAFIARILGGG